MQAPAPAASPTGARLLDATLSETILNPGRVLDQGALDAVCRALPIPGLASAAPLYPEGSNAWKPLVEAATRAIVLEPLTRDAHRNAHRHLEHLQKQNDDQPGVSPLPLPAPHASAQRVLVDPDILPLEQMDTGTDDATTLPDGWVRERVVTLPAPPTEKQGGTLPRRRENPDVLPRIALLVASMPRNERLRIRDPHGAITPELAARLAGLADAPRLTLHLENPDGLGPATARAALAGERGPLVRTTLLGIGPRTGLPPTELLRPPTTSTIAESYQKTIHVLEHQAGLHVSPTHPYWGSARKQASQIEPHTTEDPANLRPNPATLAFILQHHLDEWGIHASTSEKDRILARLIATVRPGESITGPVLWILLAQETDLLERAKKTQA